MAGRKPVDTGSEIQVSFSDIEQQYGQSGKEFEENALQSILHQPDAKWKKQFDRLANELKQQRMTLLTSIQTQESKAKRLGTLPSLALRNLMQNPRERQLTLVLALPERMILMLRKKMWMVCLVAIHEEGELDEEDENLYKAAHDPTLAPNDEKNLLRNIDNDFNEEQFGGEGQGRLGQHCKWAFLKENGRRKLAEKKRMP